MWDSLKLNCLRWESFKMLLNWNFLQCGAEWWQMVDKANFLDAPEKGGILPSFLQHTASWFPALHCIGVLVLRYLKVDVGWTYQDSVGGLACRGAEVSKPLSSSSLFYLSKVSLSWSFTSHRFASLNILPLIGLPLVISRAFLNSAPLTFFSHFIPGCTEGTCSHNLPLPTSEQPQPHFSHFSPQRVQLPKVTQSLLLRISLDPGSLWSPGSLSSQQHWSILLQWPVSSDCDYDITRFPMTIAYIWNTRWVFDTEKTSAEAKRKISR